MILFAFCCTLSHKLGSLTTTIAQHWRTPVGLLVLMAMAMPLTFATWMALLNNFVIEVVHFDGKDIGWLHSVREIPGFLAIAALVFMRFVREQTLALVSLALLGAASMMTAWFPSLFGLLWITLLSSIGFHYYETVNQSLQLQWLDKANAAKIMGWLVACGSGASMLAYILIVIGWKTFDLSYNFVYMSSGLCTVAIVAVCWIFYPQFRAPHPQKYHFILKRRYWLYYALQFMSGARRQIFVVFAAFMMVERFGLHVDDMTIVLLANFVLGMIFAPLMGKTIKHFGEKRALVFEYIGLILVFLAYGGVYFFGWGIIIAIVLYIVDHILFILAFAMKTYFQKIADPQDIAATASVTFTINHIAAVFLPALLGYLWIVYPPAVFLLAAAMALTSLLLACLIPLRPALGCETILCKDKRSVRYT